MTQRHQTGFLERLQDPRLFDHPVTGFELIETHISWVLLTGPFAYKIKKPMNLGFVDFSTLQKRHHFCLEELRLNRRLAPMLYLAVVPLCGSPRHPTIGGPGRPFEYAVKMLQFDTGDRLDRLLERGLLQPSHIDQLAATVARFHARAAVSDPVSRRGRPEEIHQPVMENFTTLLQLPVIPEETSIIRRLEEWSGQRFRELSEALRARKQAGHIRECHGDMHLENMVLLDGRVVIFDCIEFNPSLYWIDTMSELAFVVMDLERRGHPGLASRFLNRELELSGDYPGLQVLDYYLCYRAMVRAKVAGIRLSQESSPAGREGLRAYLRLAERFTCGRRPRLFITHGFSGSGKSFLTLQLLEQTGAIRIRSDMERKRLFGKASPTPDSIYSPQRRQQMYRHLLELADSILGYGYPVVVDATFLKREQRAMFHALARQRGVPFAILDFQAPPELLRRRIVQRQAEGVDPSEATLDVLEKQLSGAEPLTREESGRTITIDATRTEIPSSKMDKIMRSTS